MAQCVWSNSHQLTREIVTRHTFGEWAFWRTLPFISMYWTTIPCSQIILTAICLFDTLSDRYVTTAQLVVSLYWRSGCLSMLSLSHANDKCLIFHHRNYKFDIPTVSYWISTPCCYLLFATMEKYCLNRTASTAINRLTFHLFFAVQYISIAINCRVKSILYMSILIPSLDVALWYQKMVYKRFALIICVFIPQTAVSLDCNKLRKRENSSKTSQLLLTLHARNRDTVYRICLFVLLDWIVLIVLITQ